MGLDTTVRHSVQLETLFKGPFSTKRILPKNSGKKPWFPYGPLSLKTRY